MSRKWMLMGMCCLIATGLFASAAFAAPSVKVADGRVTIQEAVTDEIVAEAKKGLGDSKNIDISFSKFGTNEDLAKICAAFPNMKGLTIDGPKDLTDITPLANMKDLASLIIRGGNVANFGPLSELTGLSHLRISSTGQENGMLSPDLKWMSKLSNLSTLEIGAPRELGTLVSFEGIPAAPKLSSAAFKGGKPADLTPLQALSKLKSLDLTGSTIADLTPLTGIPLLEKLSLYGVDVRDFSPLAGCKALKELVYYATKDSDYSTLGKVTQVQLLQGGLTKLDDIAWIVNLGKLKKYSLFAEPVADYSPLAKTPVEDLQIWKMNIPAKLDQLSGVVTVKKLKLWDLKVEGSFDGLGTLVNVEELILDGMNAKDGSPADLAFVKSFAKLKVLTINKSEISNFDAVANCAALEKVVLYQPTGIESLAALKGLPNLKELQVPKDKFPADQLTGFANPNIKIAQR